MLAESEDVLRSTELEYARDLLCYTPTCSTTGSATFTVRGVPGARRSRSSTGYWFDTGVPLVIDLQP
jgi:hypothetical protein